MRKQYDDFTQLKPKDMSKAISDMTLKYINPSTQEPTRVPPSHYEKILDQVTEKYMSDITSRQFLTIMYTQLSNLKKEDENVYVPNKDGFLNGDDLSENVYRFSISHKRPCYMRFGHCERQIIPVALPPRMPNRFILANTLAKNCYYEITGYPFNPSDWNLSPGKAIKNLDI